MSYLLDGLGWLPLPWTHSLPLAVAGITFSSVCSGYTVTTIVSWRMRVIPEELVGRVFGVVRLVVLFGIFPGSILGGWLADHDRRAPDDGDLGLRLPRCSPGCCRRVTRAVRAERR